MASPVVIGVKVIIGLMKVWTVLREDSSHKAFRQILDTVVVALIAIILVKTLDIDIRLPSIPLFKQVEKVASGEGSDCEHCPTMVWIPGGEFLMGSETGRANERPTHTVSLEPLEISETEITFAQYDAFTDATDQFRRDDAGFGRDDRPVINVSWKDAVAYTKWLSKQTGSTYRLPTEAEWEYAARAETVTPYWWGHAVSDEEANCWNCGDAPPRKTMPVKSYAPNPYGLYDTNGNVLEWVLNCKVPDYENSATVGIAAKGHVRQNCPMRGIRGGSWGNHQDHATATYRNWLKSGVANSTVGFRVVKEI